MGRTAARESIALIKAAGKKAPAKATAASKTTKAAKAKVDAFYKNSDCKVYSHHADLLQHPGLDVVSLATPDHWHTIPAIEAITFAEYVKDADRDAFEQRMGAAMRAAMQEDPFNACYFLVRTRRHPQYHAISTRSASSW